MKKIVNIAKPIISVILVLALVFSATPSSVSAKPKVKLNKTKVTLRVGKTVTLKLKNNKKRVKWSTSNKKVATVTAKGKVKAKKKGKATIIAKVGKKKYKCKVTVQPKKPTKTPAALKVTPPPTNKPTIKPTPTPTVKATKISLNRTTLTLPVGSSTDLVPTIEPENATETDISWESSDTSVATVVDGKVTASALGTATITAKVGDVSTTCEVEVIASVEENVKTLVDYIKKNGEKDSDGNMYVEENGKYCRPIRITYNENSNTLNFYAISGYNTISMKINLVNLKSAEVNNVYHKEIERESTVLHFEVSVVYDISTVTWKRDDIVGMIVVPSFDYSSYGDSIPQIVSLDIDISTISALSDWNNWTKNNLGFGFSGIGFVSLNLS